MEYPQARFSYHKADITDWDELAQIFEQIYTEQGHIDIVYANAGISREEPFTVAEEKPSKPGLGMLEINLIGTIYSMSRIDHSINEMFVANVTPGSRQAGYALYDEERDCQRTKRGKEGIYFDNCLYRGPISVSDCANLRRNKSWGGRIDEIARRASSESRNSDQCGGASVHKYATHVRPLECWRLTAR